MVHPNGLVGVFKENDTPIFSSENGYNWLEYLKKVWSSDTFIMDVKRKNRLYIDRMNEFIFTQYKTWLEG